MMKKTTLITLLAFALASTSIIQSCKDEDDDPVVAAPSEFIAENASFASFMTWSLDKTNKGADPSLGAAHAGNDSTVTRDIRFKDGQNPVNGEYPLGTIIVKHTYNTDGSVKEYTAMTKRGNNFNPNFGNWEFFVLTASGEIAKDANGNAMRGANLMNGMCGGCHSKASKDFIFSK